MQFVLYMSCYFRNCLSVSSEQKIAEEDRVKKVKIRMKTSIQTVDTSL